MLLKNVPAGFMALILSMSLGAQTVAAPPPSGAARLPQTVDDYYNNNPVFTLRLVKPEPLWTRNLVEEGLKVYAPCFLPDRILLGDGSMLYALDPTTGAMAWKRKFDRDLDKFTADGDLLIYTDHRFGLMGGTTWVHAFSLKDDKQLWEQDSWLGFDLIVSKGHIYRYTINPIGHATLHSFDLQGKEEWIRKTKGAGSLFFFDDLVVTCPPGTKEIIALHAKDGADAWKIPFKGDAWEMAYHQGVFYGTRRTVNPLLHTTGTVYVNALDLASGKALWTYETDADDGWFLEQVDGIVTDGTYCVLNTNRRLIGLDAKTGKQLWVANPEQKESFLKSKPIILGGALFAIQTRKKKASILQYLDLATGKELARLEVDDEVIPPARVVGTSLFLCFRHGNMIALPLAEP